MQRLLFALVSSDVRLCSEGNFWISFWFRLQVKESLLKPTWRPCWRSVPVSATRSFRVSTPAKATVANVLTGGCTRRAKRNAAALLFADTRNFFFQFVSLNRLELVFKIVNHRLVNLISCDVNCASTCPPCKKPCEYRCQHSKCNRTCCDQCVPCQVIVLFPDLH